MDYNKPCTAPVDNHGNWMVWGDDRSYLFHRVECRLPSCTSYMVSLQIFLVRLAIGEL